MMMFNARRVVGERLLAASTASLVLAVSLLLLTRPALADEVLGCPKGLNEGEWWYRGSIIYQSMGERYDRASDSMVDLPTAWKKQVYKYGFRLGHSPVNRWEFGLLLNGTNIDLHKPTQGNMQEFYEFNLTDVWLSGAYMLAQDMELGGIDSFNAKIGAGYKFGGLDSLSDADMLAGMGDGTSTLRIGILTNSQIGRWELCNHLLYDIRGTAPEVDGWQFSNMDLADRINYKFNVGYAVNENIALTAGLFGWRDVEAEEFAATHSGKGFDGEELHMDTLRFALEFSPEGKEHNTVKLFYGTPLSVKNGMAPEDMAGLVYMFTW